MLPAFTQAAEPAARYSIATAKTHAKVTPATSKREKLICYISDEPVTGSYIPLVQRSYGGRIDAASASAVYGSRAIRATGALDVATVLTRLDSSISVTRGRR